MTVISSSGALARYPASAVVPFVLLVPVVDIVTAWLVLDEVPSALEIVGGVVMLVGVAWATLTWRSAAAPVAVGSGEECGAGHPS